MTLGERTDSAKLTGLDFLHPGFVLHRQVLALLGDLLFYLGTPDPYRFARSAFRDKRNPWRGKRGKRRGVLPSPLEGLKA